MESERKKTKGRRAKRKKEQFPDVDGEIESMLLKKGEKLILVCYSKQRDGIRSWNLLPENYFLMCREVTSGSF